MLISELHKLIRNANLEVVKKIRDFTDAPSSLNYQTSRTEEPESQSACLGSRPEV